MQEHCTPAISRQNQGIIESRMGQGRSKDKETFTLLTNHDSIQIEHCIKRPSIILVSDTRINPLTPGRRYCNDA